MMDYSQAMASIARACPKLKQMDHVTVDEERGEHMRLVVGRQLGGATVAMNGNGNGFVAEESATGGVDGEVRIKYHLQRPKQM